MLETQNGELIKEISIITNLSSTPAKIDMKVYFKVLCVKSMLSNDICFIVLTIRPILYKCKHCQKYVVNIDIKPEEWTKC